MHFQRTTKFPLKLQPFTDESILLTETQNTGDQSELYRIGGNIYPYLRGRGIRRGGFFFVQNRQKSRIVKKK